VNGNVVQEAAVVVVVVIIPVAMAHVVILGKIAVEVIVAVKRAVLAPAVLPIIPAV
jgi:hypothetical protein